MMSSTTPPSMPTMIANVFGPLSFGFPAFQERNRIDNTGLNYSSRSGDRLLFSKELFSWHAKQDRRPGSQILSQQLKPCFLCRWFGPNGRVFALWLGIR
ncbi:hypothetical protein EUGRSUZ_F02868 [Eucalyptus grandis]|uniref:Uncharacterized protein n=2 Tax=Eucalyptus grandis TaxID=71139 RepID=A0ACC3KLH1_EUCGR|nr:hypothetical protein EUGRSUZ_F02868 [Eucalyptus grandis]